MRKFLRRLFLSIGVIIISPMTLLVALYYIWFPPEIVVLEPLYDKEKVTLQ